MNICQELGFASKINQLGDGSKLHGFDAKKMRCDVCCFTHLKPLKPFLSHSCHFKLPRFPSARIVQGERSELHMSDIST
jgi:hypothetical protein